jgi:hypothetical protein
MCPVISSPIKEPSAPGIYKIEFEAFCPFALRDKPVLSSPK